MTLISDVLMNLSAYSCFLMALTYSTLFHCLLSKVDLIVYRSLSWKYYLWWLFYI